jgi:hypothetical protein
MGVTIRLVHHAPDLRRGPPVPLTVVRRDRRAVGCYDRAVLAGVASVVLAILMWASPTSASPGNLEVTAAPTQLTPAESIVVVRIANTGGGPVSDITIDIRSPTGISASARPSSIDDLRPGSSTVVTVMVTGASAPRPAFLVLLASGESESGQVTALATVELVAAEAPAALALVGNTRMTDASPAILAAVITNLSDAPISVALRADAGQHETRLAKEGENVGEAPPGAGLAVDIGPRDTTVATVQVTAQPPLRRGKAGLVVTVTVSYGPGAEPATIVATRELDVELSGSDLLPGLLGVSSVLVLPGLLAVLMWLLVDQRDRKRLGVETPNVAKQLWDNKLWLLAAGATSLVILRLYSAAGFPDLLDAFTLSDLFTVTVIAGLLGAASSALRVWVHRRRVPLITSSSDERAVLKAAARADQHVHRVAYKTSTGQVGLLVHRDREALVLSPRVFFSRPDSLADAIQRDDLRAASKAMAADFDGRFPTPPEADHIRAPMAVTNAVAQGREQMLEYGERR